MSEITILGQSGTGTIEYTGTTGITVEDMYLETSISGLTDSSVISNTSSNIVYFGELWTNITPKKQIKLYKRVLDI